VEIDSFRGVALEGNAKAVMGDSMERQIRRAKATHAAVAAAGKDDCALILLILALLRVVCRCVVCENCGEG